MQASNLRGAWTTVEPLSRQRLEIDAVLTAQSEEISGDVHVFAKKMDVDG